MSFSSDGKAKHHLMLMLISAVVCSTAFASCTLEAENYGFETDAAMPAALPSVTEYTTSEAESVSTLLTEEMEPDSETVSAGQAACSQTETAAELPEPVSTAQLTSETISESVTTSQTTETTTFSETAIQTTADGAVMISETEISTEFVLPETEIPDPSEAEPVMETPMYEKDFFSNDLFIGDSISTGYSLYGFLDERNVFAKIGLNPSTVLTKNISTCYGEIGIEAMLGYTDPKRAYIMLGSNGIQWLSIENMLHSTDTLVTLIKNACPQCEVVIVSVPPVTYAYDTTVPDVDVMSKIDSYNTGLSDYCAAKNMLFVDAASCLKDSTGYFDAAYAESDGMHFKASAYKTLLSKIQAEVEAFEELNPSEWIDPSSVTTVSTETEPVNTQETVSETTSLTLGE